MLSKKSKKLPSKMGLDSNATVVMLLLNGGLLKAFDVAKEERANIKNFCLSRLFFLVLESSL